ncbi:transposase [Streptomyces sp. PanSC19]|uniref:transposase n=1 Tax=Streptomyces sp. PanSC19 TaxID=1520455 RepID=UPI0016186526|nr:transposase [Streptomyces sp. PanSC19]
MTDAKWARVLPLLPVPGWMRGRGGRPEAYCHPAMLDAIRYLVDNGIKWRAMPADFPPWDRIYAFFRRWRDNALVKEFHDRLRVRVREELGRDAEPTAAVIDSQSVKADAVVGTDSRGFDGGKLIDGLVEYCLATFALVLTIVNRSDHRRHPRPPGERRLDRPPLPRNHHSYPRPAETRRSRPERQQLLSPAQRIGIGQAADLWETDAMARDRAAATKMSELFDPAPARWGLRGDPHVWQALRDALSVTDVPPSAEAVAGLLRATFEELVEVDLHGEPAPHVYRERYAHGGTSGGMVHLDTWRQTLLPLLVERAGRPRDPRTLPAR